jgi:hypothetical protein
MKPDWAGLPGPVVHSLVVTMLIAYVLALGISVSVGISVTTIQSIIWRATLVVVLLWVEIRRQSMRVFLTNLGVSRRRTMSRVMAVYLILEVAMLLAAHGVAPASLS